MLAKSQRTMMLPKKFATRTAPFAQPDEAWRRDIDRRNALDRVRVYEFPDLPSSDELPQEFDTACATLKAICDRLRLTSRKPSAERDAEFVDAAIRLCSPFRSFMLTAAEHCRGAAAAVVSKRKNGDNLYWMGGMHFRVADPCTLGSEPYVNSRRVLKDGWAALDIVSELLARLEQARGSHKGFGPHPPPLPCPTF